MATIDSNTILLYYEDTYITPDWMMMMHMSIFSQNSLLISTGEALWKNFLYYYTHPVTIIFNSHKAHTTQ